MSSQKNFASEIVALMGAAGALWAAPLSHGQTMTRAKCDIPFVGSASGGTLVIANDLNRNCKFVALETAPGEPARSVAERLAQAISEQNPFVWLGCVAGRISPLPSGSSAITVSASEGILVGLIGSCANYMTAGTEVGLGIPAAPSSLTCNYDPASKTLRLRWRNPPSSAYESIRLVSNYHNYDWRAEDLLPGTQDTYVFDMSTPFRSTYGAINDFDVWVIGVSHDIPSSAAALHVRGRVQEELFGIPFARGVAPNWTAWSVGKTGGVRCEEGQRDELMHKSGAARYNPVAAPDQKPFYQIMRTTGEHGGIGGIWREYLGLTPGHVYRLTVRVNTLDLGPDSGRWSYSLHAVAYHSSSPAITPEQMAGLLPLPDGSRGDPAGLIAGDDARRTTAGRYEECTGELVLPDGRDSITVWLRLSADRPDIKVAMDYARLEDLGRP